MSQLIHNECVKMSANYFNSMGIVALATGVIVPVLSIGIVGTPISLWTFLPPVLGLVVSLLLNHWGHSLLGRLRSSSARHSCQARSAAAL